MKNKLKKLYQQFKNLIVKLHQWALSKPTVVRIIHTFWMTAVSYIAIHPIHTSTDVKVILIGAGAAGLSAVKNLSWPLIVAWASSQTQQITPGQ